MTIRQAIEYCDSVKRNVYPFVNKVRWLNDIDHKIWREVILTHVGKPAEDLKGYDADSDADSELLVPDPYALDLYNFGLQAAIDKENGELQKYAASSQLFNQAYKEYYSAYNRTHMPITRRHHFKF